MTTPEDMNAGVQPLDALLDSAGLKNHDLVAALPDLHLTHKEIGKARKGRRLTGHTQRRVLAALNACLKTRGEPAGLSVEQVFNYRGR